MPKHLGLIAAALPAAMFLTLSAVHAGFKENDVPFIDTKSLIGYWRKVTEADSASRYPGIIEIRANGVYDAPGGAEAGAYWHGGDWAVTEDSHIVLQVANDAMVRYRIVEVTGVQLILEDSDGIRFSYRRVRK